MSEALTLTRLSHEELLQGDIASFLEKNDLIHNLTLTTYTRLPPTLSYSAKVCRADGEMLGLAILGSPKDYLTFAIVPSCSDPYELDNICDVFLKDFIEFQTQNPLALDFC